MYYARSIAHDILLCPNFVETHKIIVQIINIMSDRSTIISGRGGFIEFGICVEYQGEPAPTEIMVN